ncbi:MAG TPA: hypothetical protein VFR97_11485 [Capillimicrobium sp.]|nr:hypothetical protein [Capillimicrobium sp.]
MSRTPLAALAAAGLALGTFASPAVAAKAPTKSQARHIEKAVRAQTDNLNPKWFEVDRIKISSLSRSWALAWQTATKRGEGKFQPAYFILVQPTGITKDWTVVSYGTALVGCGIAPDSVIKDLTGGDGCPPGEGIKGS